jgi:hypothetical protein
MVDGSDRLWVFDVCQVIDALAEDASDIIRLPNSATVTVSRR